jgi:hypothetical protein
MHIASTKTRRIPITFDELIKIYKDNGLEAEILQIIDVFKKVEEKYDNVQIKMMPSGVGLNIWNIERKIAVAISSNPNGDNGVWVFDASLYDKVYELGQTLGLQVRKGTSTNFSKIIYFNGIDGIKNVAGKMQNLIEGLIKIVESSKHSML